MKNTDIFRSPQQASQSSDVELFHVGDSIIGQCLVDGTQAVIRASEIIDETDFPGHAHSIIFAVCEMLVAEGKPVGLPGVNTFLKENQHRLGQRFEQLTRKFQGDPIIQLVCSAAETASLFQRNGYSSDLQSNCKYLRRESQRKKAAEIAQHLHADLVSGENIDKCVNDAFSQFFALSASGRSKPFSSLQDAIGQAIRETETELAGGIVRLSTGLSNLDTILYGLEHGRLYVIAAEEKVGKSLLANQIALHNATKGHATGIISMEMRAGEIGKRLAGTNNGASAPERLGTLKRFRDHHKETPLFIRDGSAGPAKVLMLAKQIYAEKTIELLVIDYLQLVDLTGRDRVNEINDFVGKLKGLALDLDIPVILICGLLNKQINARGDRKPHPADLRDSGRIANDADCLLMLWKPEEADQQYIEGFVARSRYSKLGRVGLRLDPDTLRLSQVPVRDTTEVPLKMFKRM